MQKFKECEGARIYACYVDVHANVPVKANNALTCSFILTNLEGVEFVQVFYHHL